MNLLCLGLLFGGSTCGDMLTITEERHSVTIRYENVAGQESRPGTFISAEGIEYTVEIGFASILDMEHSGKETIRVRVDGAYAAYPEFAFVADGDEVTIYILPLTN